MQQGRLRRSRTCSEPPTLAPSHQRVLVAPTVVQVRALNRAGLSADSAFALRDSLCRTHIFDPLSVSCSAGPRHAKESCRFTLNRSPFSTPFSRIVPVPTRGGFGVHWEGLLQAGSSEGRSFDRTPETGRSRLGFGSRCALFWL